MQKNAANPLVVFALVALLISVPLICIHVYFSGNWYSIGHDYSLAMLFGIASYCCFCFTLVLSTRIRFLDRQFGHDKVLRIHGYLAAVALATGTIHFVFKTSYLEMATLQIIAGITGLSLSVSIALITFSSMTAGPLAGFPFIAAIRKFISKRFTLDYSRAKFFHNVFSGAVALFLLHVMLASSTRESLVRVVCMGALGGAVLLRYSYHKFLRPTLNLAKKYHLANIEKLTSNITRLTISSTRGKKFLFVPGQFAYLSILSPETGTEEHPFSISSSPDFPSIQMTIKNIGDYTSRLGNLKIGTRVRIDGPYGTFTPVLNERNKVFIAGGIGITPFLSVLSSWQTQKLAPKTTLFWSVAHKEDFIDNLLFEHMAKICSWFSFIPMLTQEHHDRYEHGRITPELIARSGVGENKLTTDFYLCGPLAMIRQLERFLKAEGVAKRNIHYELFAF